jgi:hypothetical protein
LSHKGVIFSQVILLDFIKFHRLPYEESYQEDLDEFYHVKDPYDTFDEDEAVIYVLPLDEDVHVSTPPKHEDKEMVIFSHVGGLMKEILDMVDEHIDTFLQTGKCRWDFVRLIFYRDPIHDIVASP